jgi:hypothetical protein
MMRLLDPRQEGCEVRVMRAPQLEQGGGQENCGER